MDFVKREERNAGDEESYKAYIENLQKSQQEAVDYQHTSLSMEQLHQAVQSSLNASSLVHNFQIPLSPRQMSTLMLKTNQFSRNINFNDIPAHLPRNLASEIDLVHNLTNELPQNLGRHDDLISRSLDLNLARSLSNEMELHNSITQSLVQNLTEHELQRSFNAELSRISEILPHNIRSELPHDLNHELDLSLHLNRQNLNQDILSQDEHRRLAHSETESHFEPNHRLDHGTPKLDHSLTQRLDHNLSRLEQSFVQRLESLTPRVEQTLSQRLDQRAGIHEIQRQLVNEQMLPVPFHIKSEQEDDYFNDNMNQGMWNSGIVGHIQGHQDQHPSSSNVHQEQVYNAYTNHIPNLPALSAMELYTRQNYTQNSSPTTVSRENPQNLVVHRQFENNSPYQEKRQDDANAGKSDAKSEQPKENLKPTDQNKMYYTDYQNMQYVDSDKNDTDSNAHKLVISDMVISDELALNIKGEYSCYKCNEVFPSKRGLKQHSKGCSDGDAAEKMGKYTCSQCAYRCQSPAILKIHERTHSGEKPFSCTFCDYKSGQKNNVAKHILVHMKEKPFGCQYCEYRCAQKNNLVVHERTHTGYKPFGCPYCDYRTVQKPNLVKHMYLHTDQKPFSCDICSYRCVQKTNLTKHKQRHFNERSGEKVEIKSQSKPYRPRQKSVVCSLCPYRCVQKSSLEKHMQYKHSRQDYTQSLEGLNLMKSDENVKTDEVIQNLSVKKDDILPECQDSVVESLEMQS